MQRYKRIFGNRMKARELPQQKTEAWISVTLLNHMTSLGMPVSQLVASFFYQLKMSSSRSIAGF